LSTIWTIIEKTYLIFIKIISDFSQENDYVIHKQWFTKNVCKKQEKINAIFYFFHILEGFQNINFLLMRKLAKLYSLAIAFGISFGVANAQDTEGAARMGATEYTTIAVEPEKKVVEPEKKQEVVSATKETPIVVEKAKTPKVVEAPQENLEIKTLNTSKKVVKGERILKNLKPEKKEQVNVSGKVKIAIILIAIGIILSILPLLWFVGVILVVVGLVLLLLELL
jgi:hypothetical protein